MIREVTLQDTQQLCEIYNYYITNTFITFEEELVDKKDMEQRIKKVVENNYPFYVYEEEGEVLGFAYAGRFRERSAYRFTVELTVYVKHDAVKKGIGSKLYTELLNTLKAKSFHIAVSCIALPNEASVKLHEKLGFEKAGELKDVGYKFNQWLDVGYWQIPLS